MIVQAAPLSHFNWLMSKIEYVPTRNVKAIEAVDEHGQIFGMIGYDNWTPNSVEMHFAISSIAAAKALLRPAFEYPFLQGEKRIVMGRIPACRKSALRFAQYLGFHVAYRVKNGWADGVDLIFVQMPRSECRWLVRKAA